MTHPTEAPDPLTPEDARREALEPYLHHRTGCRVWATPRATEGATDERCTCGLRAALRAATDRTTLCPHTDCARDHDND